MFDIAQHQRERLRRLERENRALREQNAQAYRMLAIAVLVAARGVFSPLEILGAIEEIDAAA